MVTHQPCVQEKDEIYNSNLTENFKFVAKKLDFISIFSFHTQIFSSFDRLNGLIKE
jgi:hypothetical protein